MEDLNANNPAIDKIEDEPSTFCVERNTLVSRSPRSARWWSGVDRCAEEVPTPASIHQCKHRDLSSKIVLTISLEKIDYLFSQLGQSILQQVLAHAVPSNELLLQHHLLSRPARRIHRFHQRKGLVAGFAGNQRLTAFGDGVAEIAELALEGLQRNRERV